MPVKSHFLQCLRLKRRTTPDPGKGVVGLELPCILVGLQKATTMFCITVWRFLKGHNRLTHSQVQFSQEKRRSLLCTAALFTTLDTGTAQMSVSWWTPNTPWDILPWTPLSYLRRDGSGTRAAGHVRASPEA